MSISTKFYTKKLSTWQLDSGYVDLYVVPKKCNASPSTSGEQQRSSLRGSPMPTASGLHSVLFYSSQSSASAQDRADLFERLVACWQDRGSSLHRLEKLLLDKADQDLLHTIIYSLFCPSTEGKDDLKQGPGKRNGGEDPR